jgi:hypothetical protein
MGFWGAALVAAPDEAEFAIPEDDELADSGAGAAAPEG